MTTTTGLARVTVAAPQRRIDLALPEHVPLADLLSINGSYRRSNYSTGKNTDTYGVGAEWAPVRNYRARASYQLARVIQQSTDMFSHVLIDLTGFKKIGEHLCAVEGSEHQPL